MRMASMSRLKSASWLQAYHKSNEHDCQTMLPVPAIEAPRHRCSHGDSNNNTKYILTNVGFVLLAWLPRNELHRLALLMTMQLMSVTPAASSCCDKLLSTKLAALAPAVKAKMCQSCFCLTRGGTV